MYGVPKRVQGRVAHDALLVLLILLVTVVLPAGVAAEPVSRAARLPGKPGFMQVGTASWYGEWHHGRTTANGERFDMYAMTAAHKSLPLGTRIRVTNLANSKTVSLRINDRGPYIHDRVLDVSLAAARRLDFVERGLTPVRIMVLPFTLPVPLPPERLLIAQLPRPTSKPVAPNRRAPGDEWMVQIAAVWNQDDADTEWRRISSRHARLLQHHTPRIEQRLSQGREVFRLQIGSFPGRDRASDVCTELKSAGQDCFVVSSARAQL